MLNKIVFLFLLVTTSLFAQFDVISLKLVNADNTPNTGEASNITFRRSPFTEGNVISGLTVTEVGVTGNYTVEGFSTFERVKYYLSGIEQTWWGGANGKYVGNITAYITSLLTGYVTIATGQTISGIKNFSSLTTFTGKVQQLANENFEMYRPQLHASSPWISWIELPSNALPSVLWGDSAWGRKHWYTDGTNIRLDIGYKLLGRTNTVCPINVNTNHFEYSGDQLSLKYALNFDSLTLKKDTIISENQYTKSWDMKRRYFNQRDSMDLNWYYRNTLTNTKDSFSVINTSYHSNNNSSVGLSGSTWVFSDTLNLPSFGTWQITYSAVCVFPAATGPDAYDTIWTDIGTGTGSDKQLPGSEAYITHYYESSRSSGGAHVISWSVVYHSTADNRNLFLRGRNTTGAVGTMYIDRSNVTYTRIK